MNVAICVNIHTIDTPENATYKSSGTWQISNGVRWSIMEFAIVFVTQWDI